MLFDISDENNIYEHNVATFFKKIYKKLNLLVNVPFFNCFSKSINIHLFDYIVLYESENRME